MSKIVSLIVVAICVLGAFAAAMPQRLPQDAAESQTNIFYVQRF